MATNRDLLKEAIADAKAVKEMAIANAKAALEESFTPHLKSMLATKLQEMEEIDEEVEEIEEGEMAMYDEDDTEPMMEEEDFEELDLEELLSELNEAEDEEDMEDEAEEADEDMESETEEETMDLEDMSEEDLKSFIEDVIADMVEAGELEAGEGMEGEDMEDEEMETEEEEEEVNIDELLAEIDSMDETYHDDDMMKEVENLDEVSVVGDVTPDQIPYIIAGIASVIGLASSSSWLPKVKEWFRTNKGEEISDVEAKNIVDKGIDIAGKEGVEDLNPKTPTELDEAYSTIKTLRSELNEVNLLNAKLLYTNKIFKGKNLTESQKLKVLNSFDKTTTVKEVKLVYETLKEGITTSKKPLSENLGSASKAMGTTKKPIIEANDAFSRMREIAFYSAKH